MASRAQELTQNLANAVGQRRCAEKTKILAATEEAQSMYVCLYIYIGLYTYIYIYFCIYENKNLHVRISMYTSIYINISV